MREQDLPVLETYANAVSLAAHKADLFEQTVAEARELADLLAATPALSLFLRNPSIEKKEKKALVRGVFTERLSPLMLHLPLLLIDKNRGGSWLDVLRHFVACSEREQGIFEARVATANALDDTQSRRLQESLEAFTGKRLRIDFEVEPALIGGVRFRYGDTLIDGSLLNGLKRIRRRLEGVRIE